MMNTRVLCSVCYPLYIFNAVGIKKVLNIAFNDCTSGIFSCFLFATLKKGTVVDKPPVHKSFSVGNNEKNVGSTRKSAAPQT